MTVQLPFGLERLINGLTAIGNRQTPKEDAANPAIANAILCLLPSDVLLLIVDELSATDRLRLSHTCKDLRVVATFAWPSQLRNFTQPAPSRATFSAAFVNVSLDHWLCYECHTLHKVDYTHTTRTPVRVPRKCRFKDLYRKHLASNYFGGNHVGQDHIQLAIKYSRNRSLDANQVRFYNALMAPVAKSMQYPIQALHLGSMPCVLAQWYYARAKIVNNRYLLFQRWVYRPGDTYGVDPPLPLTRQRFWPTGCSPRICPHMDGKGEAIYSEAMDEEVWDGLTTLQKGLFHLLDQQQPLSLKMSCRVCPTDCRIEFIVDENGYESLDIRAWKDLGAGHGELTPPAQWEACTDENYAARESRTRHTPGKARSRWEKMKGRPIRPVGELEPLPAVQADVEGPGVFQRIFQWLGERVPEAIAAVTNMDHFRLTV